MTDTHLKLAVVLVFAALSACSPTAGPMAKADDHFTCAAMIGALDRLAMNQGEPNVADIKARLDAGMKHLNAWAVPKQLPEQEAFEQVKAERERLIATLPVAEIATRAQACINGA